MFRLLNRTFGLLTLVIGAVALIAVLNNVVVYAESAAVDETQQNGPEANLKYLFAVFFLGLGFFLRLHFFSFSKIKRNEK